MGIYIFGHPVHVATQVENWTNPHGTRFATVTARCGYMETSGQLGATRMLGQYRPGKGVECPYCWDDGWAQTRTTVLTREESGNDAGADDE